MKTKSLIIISIFFTFIFFISCKTIEESFEQSKAFKGIYIDQFKLTYFRYYLLRSYNHTNTIKEIIQIDHSGFTEPVLTIDDLKLIDSLTKIDNVFLVKDSLQGVNRAEGSQGKRPLGYIMYKLRSKWLDSIAIKRYKIFKGNLVNAD